MKLSDFRPWIESLRKTYNDVKDQLGKEDHEEAFERAFDVIRLWNQALGGEYEFSTEHAVLVLHGQEAVDDHKGEFKDLEEALKQRDAENITAGCRLLLGTLKNYVADVAKIAKNKAATLEGNGAKHLALTVRNDGRTAEMLLTQIEQANLSHSLRMAVKEATAAVKEAQSAAESAKTAAGVASGSKLTQRFAALSKQQLRTATRFRWLTAVGVLVGIGGTYWIAFASGASHSGGTTTGDAIIRVSLLGAVLGLATYFGRQAGYHRDIGTWAKTIEEQLLTFDGYMEPIHDETIRDGMRAAFAARVFGSTPESKDDSGVTLGSSFINELLAAVGKSGTKS
jgi:hypothetical protein